MQVSEYMRKRTESKGFVAPFTDVELAFMQQEYHVCTASTYNIYIHTYTYIPTF